MGYFLRLVAIRVVAVIRPSIPATTRARTQDGSAEPGADDPPPAGTESGIVASSGTGTVSGTVPDSGTTTSTGVSGTTPGSTTVGCAMQAPSV